MHEKITRRGFAGSLSLAAIAGGLQPADAVGGEPEVQAPQDSWDNVKQYGVKGDGVADDTRGLRAAIAGARGRTLFFPPGAYRVTDTLVLDQGQVKIVGSGPQGTTTIVKYHPGDAIVVDFAQVEFQSIAIESGSPPANVSGRAVHVVRGENFRFLNCSIANIDTGIEFAADAGAGAMIANCRIAPYTTTPGREGCSIRVAGPDTAARDRHVVDLSTGGGVIELHGCRDFFIANCMVRNIFADAATFGLHVVNCRYGSMGKPVTFDGMGCTYIGCMIAGELTLAPTLIASTVVGNMATQANYGFNDRTVVGNNLILHGVHTAGKNLNKHLIPNVAGRTLALSGVSPDRGDADVTLTADTDAPVQRFATPLRADRKVTLSLRGAYPGARFRVTRTGLGQGQLDVGGLRVIPSATAAFVDVECDGQAWVLTGYGNL
jgi:hypothetical protein